MDDQNQGPERIWADEVYGRVWEYEYIHGLQVPYVRADLHDALAKERDELQSEVERLNREIDDIKSFCKGISINIEKMLGPATKRGE